MAVPDCGLILRDASLRDAPQREVMESLATQRDKGAVLEHFLIRHVKQREDASLRSRDVNRPSLASLSTLLK